MEITKIDENTIEVKKIHHTVQRFKLDALMENKQAILGQMAEIEEMIAAFEETP